MIERFAGRLVGWIAGLLVLIAGFSAQAAEPVVVRCYAMATMSTGALARARATASSLLDDASVQIVWRDCSKNACEAPLETAELVLRIVSSSPMTAPGTLGSSTLDLSGGSGTLATVFADRVSVVAERNGIDAGTLLGRAMAHEIGHVLLGTAVHASSGLMRAEWRDRELRRDAPADWVWSAAEIDAIHEHLIARRREPIPAVAVIAASVANALPIVPNPTTCHAGRCVSR
jgi:hypothetical protein